MMLKDRRDLGLRIGWRAMMWRERRRASPVVRGGLERPDRIQRFSRSVDVRGWVAVPRGRSVAVEVFAGPTLLTRVSAVPAAGAPDGDEARSSFEAVIPLDHVPAGFWLRIVAVADGQERTVIGLSRMVRARPRDRQVPRAAYGTVWDSVASSLSNAQFSVAGTNDMAALLESGRSTADDVARETAIGASDTVLEIGCGVARVGASLAPRCRQWIGADVSAEMLRHARAALAGRDNVSFVHLNGVDLAGVADESVDVAYCTGVFMHLDEWERYRYLAESFRVLRPGGRVYVDNINLLSPDGWTIFSQTMRMDPLARPVNVSKTSTPEELMWFASQAGFVDARSRGGTLWITVIARKPAATAAG